MATKKKVTLEVGDPNVELPFETASLRKGLEDFLNSEVEVPSSPTPPKAPGKRAAGDPELEALLARAMARMPRRIGDFRWGVYAFFDFDGEPIYVGQTNEKLRTRIRRHLTNQRTDAVAMSVLDPFEVCEVQVWPLPEFEGVAASDAKARSHLNAVEYLVFQKLLAESSFKAVLNEVEPRPVAGVKRVIPQLTMRKRVVSEAVSALRDHPDLRIARRAATLARLAKIISERKVQKGLRVVLHTQARRLEALARKRIPEAVDLKPEEERDAEEEGKTDVDK